MYNSKNNKNILILVLVMLAGIIVGGFLGELISNAANSIDFLSFLNPLNYSRDFGLTTPVGVDLGIISFSLGLTIRFSVWGVIGMIVSVIIYRKM